MQLLICYTPKDRNLHAEVAVNKHISLLPIADDIKKAICSRSFMDANPAYYIDHPFVRVRKSKMLHVS